MNFNQLIEPLDTQLFFNDYFEKKPLVIKRNNDTFFSGLLQLQDIENILFTKDILSKINMRMIKNGDPIPVQQYLQIEKLKNIEVKSGIFTDEVERLFNKEKATFVLEQTKDIWPAVSQLLLSINNTFHCTSNTNIYVSPPGASGFNIHYDSHDVFVLQIAGSKHWKIYNDPYYLPLGIHHSRPFDTNSLELLYDVEIEEGDTIYIPRGFVHEASTSYSLSAHITAGVYNTTLAKTLADYIIGLASGEGLLRESIVALLNKPDTDLIARISQVLINNLSMDVLKPADRHEEVSRPKRLFETKLMQ